MKILGLSFIIILCLCSGCRTGKLPPAVIDQKDSIRTVIKTVIKETVKDSLVYINQDEASLQALLECDSNGKVLLKQLLKYKAGKHAAVPEMRLDNNVLDVVNRVDSFSIYLQWKERYTSVDTSTLHDKLTTITNTVRIHYLTWWDKLFIKAGKILLAILLIFTGYKLITQRLTIINTLRKWVA